MASGNFLLFIAFNFTIGIELPRLGYVTVVDAYLAGLFVITGTVVLANVMLKRMQNTGRGPLLQRFDRFALMASPLGYLLLIGAIAAMLIWHERPYSRSRCLLCCRRIGSKEPQKNQRESVDWPLTESATGCLAQDQIPRTCIKNLG